MSRVGGLNGILLLITAALGFTGVILSLMPVPFVDEPLISQIGIATGGIIAYVAFLLITKGVFHRIVTTELILIVGWTTLEMVVADRLYAAGAFDSRCFWGACMVIAVAFLISIVLYVAYYRMEEMKAFYAAMVPLVTEAVAMMVVVEMVAAS